MARRKKTAAARYAFIGLIVAALACISSGLLGAAKAGAGVGMFIIPNPESLNRYLYVSLAVMILGVASYAIATPDSVRRFLGGRQARYGSNALVMTLAFAGIIFVANYLAYQYPKSFDVTEEKSHTLAPETLQALATLPDEVTAIAFFTAPNDTAEQLLRDFKANSNGKFDYRVVNPDLDPLAAREAGITGEGNIMLLMGEQKEIASFASETELARALIRLISPGARAVYFLTGHGEPDLESAEQTGFSIARSTLESKNYAVNSLNLLSTNKVPDDALAIIVAGPKKPLSIDEVSLLREYVAKGGSLVVMEDPLIFTEFGAELDPLAPYLARTWGITLNDDVIIDPSSQTPLVAISATARPHPITQNMTYVVILPQARSLDLIEVEGVTQTALLLTSEQAWSETNFTDVEGGLPPFDEGQDKRGELDLAVAAENTETKGRVVVFGNSVFATDEAFNALGNANVFVNSVDWAAEQEDLINITPRTPISRTFIPPSSVQQIAIVIGSVIVLPGLVLAAGVYSWLSRRRKG